jgi:CDP-glucose 4,6-dehydratase
VEATSKVEVTLIITTDKVYRQESGVERAFVETDALGAADPYSTSKAMADLLTQSWIKSHPSSRIAIARAGNVIGGGDVAQHRLLPDLVRAFGEGKSAVVRNPASVRPWQHVVDCLAGYVSLVEALLENSTNAGAFNFGPSPSNPLKVGQVVEIAAGRWSPNGKWHIQQTQHKDESTYLVLDSTKSMRILGWRETLSPKDAIEWTIDWHLNVDSGQDPLSVTLDQLSSFWTLQDKKFKS